MDKIHRIEDFLRLMASASKNGMYIDSDSVYANLIYLGVDSKRCSISSNFDRWIEHFNSVDNINVFVDPGWSYFCQFINSNYDEYCMNCNIKLYIPVDSEHIEKGAIELFEFLAKENIPHISKIGRCIRFDDIVVRTDTSENANKIIEFVNNNQYIRDGLLPTNPFAVNDSNISMIWDDSLSYNMVVSNWISNYINWECDNNNLDNVSYSRFYAFIQDKSYTLFEEGKGIDEYTDKLMVDGVIKNDGFHEMIDHRLVNYYNITKLLLMTLGLEIEKEELFEFINIVSNAQHNQRNIAKMHFLRTNKLNGNKGFSEQQKAAFRLSYEYMCESYGEELAKMHFLRFIETGKYSCISRNKGARELLINNNIDSNIADLIVSYWKCEALDNAIFTTYDKYGYSHAYSALANLMANNDFSRFTNDNNSRRELIYRCSGGDVVKSVRKVLINEGYLSSAIQNGVCKIYFDRTIKNNIKNGKRI